MRKNKNFLCIVSWHKSLTPKTIAWIWVSAIGTVAWAGGSRLKGHLWRPNLCRWIGSSCIFPGRICWTNINFQLRFSLALQGDESQLSRPASFRNLAEYFPKRNSMLITNFGNIFKFWSGNISYGAIWVSKGTIVLVFTSNVIFTFLGMPLHTCITTLVPGSVLANLKCVEERAIVIAIAMTSIEKPAICRRHSERKKTCWIIWKHMRIYNNYLSHTSIDLTQIRS